MKGPSSGFTLFEVILSIALAAMLLTLIGTAINLYLFQVDAGRTRVEEAQLARSVLSMMAADIRATTIYKPQDTSAVAQLMAKSAAFNVDDIDKASDANAGGMSKLSSLSGGSGATPTLGAIGSGTSAAGGAAGASSSSASSDTADDTTLQLGINGDSDNGLYVDATRLPKQEELFSTTTGYTNAQSPTSSGGALGSTGSGGIPATDLKTVRYYIRPGDAVDAGSASATSLDPASQSRIGGLVRQEIPRAMRNFAEKNGGSDMLDSNSVLLSPEVVRMQIRFFNGSEIAEIWDMKEQKKLPVAVEICIWVRSPNATSEPIVANDTASLSANTHEYRQVVYVPMAQVANAAQSSTTTGTSTTDSTDSTDTSSSNGSAFGQETQQ